MAAALLVFAAVGATIGLTPVAVEAPPNVMVVLTVGLPAIEIACLCSSAQLLADCCVVVRTYTCRMIRAGATLATTVGRRAP